MQIITKRVTFVWRDPYITDGLVAMWDGQWNAPGGIHDPAATNLYELVSGKYETLPGTVFSSWPDHWAVETSTGYGRPTALTSAFATAVSRGRAHLEAVVFCNVNAGTVYGNNLGILGGSLGYNPHTGNGGINAFSSGWIAAKDTALVGAPSARLAIDIDTATGSLAYSVGTATGNGLINIPTSVADGFYILSPGSRIYCVRAYSRLLAPEEVTFNAEIDKARFGC